MAVVGEQAAVTGETLEVLGGGGDVAEVREEEGVAVAFRKLESEGTFLVERVLEGVNVVGPGEGMTEEGVRDGMIGGNSKGKRGGGGRGRGTRKSEAAAASRGRARVVVVVERREVKGDMAVEVVEVNAAIAIELGDVEVDVGREEVRKSFIEGVE